jgi:hypothetical protein
MTMKVFLGVCWFHSTGERQTQSMAQDDGGHTLSSYFRHNTIPLFLPHGCGVSIQHRRV